MLNKYKWYLIAAIVVFVVGYVFKEVLFQLAKNYWWALAVSAVMVIGAVLGTKILIDWWSKKEKNVKAGIFSLFDFVLSEDSAKKIEELDDELTKLKAAKETWLSKPENQKISEDDLKTIKAAIRKFKEEINNLNDEIKKKPTKGSLLQQKSALEKLLENENEKLGNLKKKLKDNKSSIEIAKKECEKFKIEKAQRAKKIMAFAWWLWALATFVVSFFLAVSAYLLISEFTPLKNFLPLLPAFLIGTASFLSINSYFLKSGYVAVPYFQEWVMEFFGKFLVIWELGPHFVFPFFMKRKGRVFTGTQQISLCFDSKEIDGKISAKVDFSDASAEVIVTLFYRIFDAYKSQYEIDNLKSAISEKMESGIRAYYGSVKLDDAIKTRSEIDLRSIIIQDATGAEDFKNWGVEIISLAVTDIKLPPGIETLRERIITAEKELETKNIEVKTAKVRKDIAKIDGQGEAVALTALGKAFDGDTNKAADFNLITKKYKAYEKAGVLIAGDADKTSAAFVGTTAGAAANVGAKAVEKK